MKNLTRVLALVLTFAMMISTVAMAAAFTDVEAGSTYAEATAVLADLGILNGYTDGSFGPEKAITRAEAVAVINRLQGLSDAAKAAGGSTQYTDVAADAWYAGDINLATQMGVVAGNGNGTFRPEAQVKFEEAVKMVVAALGYQAEYVDKKGGWPTGYLVIASEQGITKGLSATAGEPAVRGIVAKLAYNALTAPTYGFDGYSNGQPNYQVMEKEIILETKLQAKKLTGYVAANSASSLTTADSKLDNDTISFMITDKQIGKENSDWTKGEAYPFLIGDTDVATTLGFATDIYVAETEDGDYEVVSYTINKNKNKTVVFEDPSIIQTAGDYASVLAGEDAHISIYDEEVDTTNTEYGLEADAKLIVNGQYVNTMANAADLNMFDLEGNADATLGSIYAPNYGKVTLLDNNNNGDAEYVFVESYVVDVVVDVTDTTNAKKIETNNATIDLAKHIEGKTQGYTYSITLDGAEATIADLQENDVIAVAMDQKAKSINIVAVRKTVSGVVAEADINKDDAFESEYKVDGVIYKAANVVDVDAVGIANINVGDEVTFYLDAFNNVAKAERTSSASKNYGFIVLFDQETGIGDEATYQIRLLDKEGNINTYELADYVKFADKDAAGVATRTKAEDVFKEVKKITKLYEEFDEDAIKDYANRVITYKVNSDGYISEIIMPGADVNGEDESYIAFNDKFVAEQSEFNAKTNKFAVVNKFVNEDTVVFFLPMKEDVMKEDFTVGTIASLTDEETYDVAFLSVDKDGYAGVIVVTSEGYTVDAAANLAVVKKVMTANDANGDQVYNITFVQAGEEKTLATTAKLAEKFVAPAVGSIFEYRVDANGAIDAIGKLDFITAAAAAKYPDSEESTPKAAYVYGKVYAKSTNRVITIGDNATYPVPTDANFILVDLGRPTAKNYVTVGSFADIKAAKFDKEGAIKEDTDFSVFIKLFNDEVVDVVIFKDPTTYLK